MRVVFRGQRRACRKHAARIEALTPIVHASAHRLRRRQRNHPRPRPRRRLFCPDRPCLPPRRLETLLLLFPPRRLL